MSHSPILNLVLNVEQQWTDKLDDSDQRSWWYELGYHFADCYATAAEASDGSVEDCGWASALQVLDNLAKGKATEGAVLFLDSLCQHTIEYKKHRMRGYISLHNRQTSVSKLVAGGWTFGDRLGALVDNGDSVAFINFLKSADKLNELQVLDFLTGCLDYLGEHKFINRIR